MEQRRTPTSTRSIAAWPPAQTAERALAACGNALATVGKGKTELDGVILALGQIESMCEVTGLADRCR